MVNSEMEIKLDHRSVELRKEIIKILINSRRGHIGSSFSLVEILRVLFDNVLRYRADDPYWDERDRFILSKGHGCLPLYVLLAEKGFFPREELAKFCAFGSILGGHPEYGKTPGVEASTGALGHGLSIAVGMALANKLDKRKNRVFVVVGDGECDEGSIWEAAMSASKHRLDNLMVIIDYNKMQSYGPVSEVQELEPFADKWKSFGFCVREANGHDVKDLHNKLSNIPFCKNLPSVLICHTVKGAGLPSIENDPSWHHKTKISDEELNRLLQELDLHK